MLLLQNSLDKLKKKLYKQYIIHNLKKIFLVLYKTNMSCPATLLGQPVTPQDWPPGKSLNIFDIYLQKIIRLDDPRLVGLLLSYFFPVKLVGIIDRPRKHLQLLTTLQKFYLRLCCKKFRIFLHDFNFSKNFGPHSSTQCFFPLTNLAPKFKLLQIITICLN